MQEEVVNKLKAKIDTLISAYESLREENLKLVQQNAIFESQLKQKGDLLNEFEKKVDQQQMAKALLNSSQDAQEAKLKVAQMVREIDNCIALLNR